MNSYFRRNFHYCPKCGTTFKKANSHYHCPVCHFDLYANPAPTTSIFVIQNDKLLLTKRAVKPFKGHWDSFGGFLLSEESFEQGAIREMKEESGVDINITKYLGSLPDTYRSMPTINVGFKAEIISGKLKAADDVASFHWFDFNDIPKQFAFPSVKQMVKELVANHN